MFGMLMGRDAELGLLRELVPRPGGDGTVLVVTGEAGVGKSSLLAAAGDAAGAAGCRVLRGAGVEAESRLPFAGLHQVLSPLLDDAENLPGPQRQALLTAFGLADGAAPEPFLVGLAALTLLTRGAARSPLAVLLDDVQWFDDPTGDIVVFLARRLADDPVLLIGAVREGYHCPLLATRARLLPLGRLDAESSRRLLDQVAGDLPAADRRRVLREAQGNPLALVELPSAVTAGDGPIPLNARLERSFAHRLGDLPSPTRDALLVAALDGDEEVSEILAAGALLCGRPMDVGDLEVAARAGLVRLEETRLRFRHPLVRSGLLQRETTVRRQRACAALAEVLAGHPIRRAWFRAQATTGPDDEIAADLDDAHRQSLLRGSVTAAVAALERSAQLTTEPRPRVDRLLRAAELAFGMGQADMVERLVANAESEGLSGHDRWRAEWLRELFTDGIPGDAARVTSLCDMAAECHARGDLELALNLLLGAALRCWWAETGPAARARVARTTEALTGCERDPRYMAALAVAEPIERGQTVMTLLIRAGDRLADPDGLRLLGMAAHAIGDEHRAAHLLDLAEARIRRQGRLGLLPHVLGMRGSVSVNLGDFPRAGMVSDEGRRLALDTGQPVWNFGTQVTEARTAGLLGRTDRSLAFADEVEHSLGQRPFNVFLACLQQARGYALITAGRNAEAYGELRRLFDPADPAHHQREQFCGVMFLAEAAVRADQREDARHVLADMERVAETTPSPLLHAQLRYTRAVLASDDDADRLFREGLADGLAGWDWIRARLELAFGCWLRRQRRAREARPYLRAAMATLRAIGADSWVDQAAAELKATGEHAGHATPEKLRLSPQELQIALLAARGLSNREIGERVFLSPRTVSSHLHRVFPKLGVTARSQLAGRMAALG